jgi:hypothetical protein
MPPYAERKMRLAAPIPRMSAWVRIELSQNVLKIAGARIATDERPDADEALGRDLRAVEAHATLPNRPLGTEREHERHEREREDDGVLLAAVVARDRKVRHGEREDEPVEHRPDRPPRERAHAAMITTTSE